MGQIRIIAGRWRRTPIPVPDRPGLRPTPDRVRETLFNWLQSRLGADLMAVRVLDAFSGSGALGLEAASRGCQNVTLVERDPVAIATIRTLLGRLGATSVRLLQTDALRFMADEPIGSYGLIFLDPPFQEDWLPRLLPLAHRLLTPGGLLYVEAEAPLSQILTDDQLAGFEVLRSGKAGAVFHALLCSRLPESNEEVGS